MRKSDRDIHKKTSFWYVLQIEWFKKNRRLLLLLLYRFIIGWVFFQLLVLAIAGALLLGILLFYPCLFIQVVANTEKLNHVSVELWNILNLCIWHYGVIAGFIFMLGCAMSKSIKQAQRLSRKFGA
ncbi:D-alanyl-D-alanine dipeptidase [Salmonella enterica subsp. salamae]|nr:D-alanyl-D-alanine dipeptidase [Salmonella enterica subsp. salamae]ECG8592473.1 D-alanyl-D-alanine dipeptidase [Salmonella enterica subsp. salamae]ECJ2282461.1 D-alanyl-D-alanine dipeptidase [Salmonella enterica subsp. salamae]ECJ2283642.1 D-alanyl-D-alanine dipeptidase [Salmonella enterica subsp. salamae]